MEGEEKYTCSGGSQARIKEARAGHRSSAREPPPIGERNQPTRRSEIRSYRMAAPVSNGALVLLLVTAMMALAYSASMPTHADSPLVIDSALHNQLRALMQRRKELAMVRAIIREFDQHLALIHKTTCDINMPGFECGDNAIDSGSDGWYWGSENSPGKRKRACALNLNDGSCDNKHVLGLVSDLNTWMNGPGRRRR